MSIVSMCKEKSILSIVMGIILVLLLSISTIQQTVLGQAIVGSSKNNNNGFTTNQNQTTTTRPWVGISTTYNMTIGLAKALGIKEPTGILILDIVPGSPAEKAGLHGSSKVTIIDGYPVKIGGDIILKTDNKNVTTALDYTRDISRKNVGNALKLTVLRDNQVKEINLVCCKT
jgi:S1-C subfamily serine protease